MGPTASGKTELAMALAERFPLEVVSVDSAMVYRGLDIGSGKPSAAELRRVAHHLIDIRDPAEAYSAAEFAEDARALVAAIHRRGRLPLLVGGTGLYFRAFLEGLSPLPPARAGLRQRLADETQRLGLPAMHRRLAEVDPAAARRIHATDPQRIQRALEVYELTGRPITYLQRGPGVSACQWPVASMALLPAERGWLHRRIARRFQQMLCAGLVEEVRVLAMRPKVHAALPALRAVGYRQVLEHLHGQYGYDQMHERGVIATRQLARRQLTWLRRQRVELAIDPASGAPLVSAREFTESVLNTLG